MLEYGYVVWNNCSQYKKDELYKIQMKQQNSYIGN